MNGAPTSASTGSPLARHSFIPGTPRFVWFIALFAGPARSGEVAGTNTDAKAGWCKSLLLVAMAECYRRLPRLEPETRT